jgi:XTP/dITP diphosphohydrolase
MIAEGSCPGVILHSRQGTGGFGYDPLFLYEPMNKTYAEMNAEEKNAVSHRARASEKMRQIMAEINGPEK